MRERDSCRWAWRDIRRKGSCVGGVLQEEHASSSVQGGRGGGRRETGLHPVKES